MFYHNGFRFSISKLAINWHMKLLYHIFLFICVYIHIEGCDLALHIALVSLLVKGWERLF